MADSVPEGRNLSLFLCAFLHGLNHALQLVLPPLYLAIREDLAIESLGRLMLLGTIYFVTYAVTALPYGFLGDRFSKKNILVIGTMVNSGAFLIVATTRSYSVLAAAMILGGLGGGAYHPVGNALISLFPVIVVFGMRDFCLWGATYLTPVMSQMSVGFSEKTAGLLIGLMSLTGVLSQPLGGFMSDCFGRRRVLAFALTVAGVGIVFFPHAGPVVLFPVALLSGFMILGTVPVVDAAAAQIVPPSMRGRLFGLTITLGILLGALSPYVVGMIYDLSGGYGVPFLVIGLGGFAGAALSLTVLPK
jgi:MFS family permease